MPWVFLEAPCQFSAKNSQITMITKTRARNMQRRAAGCTTRTHPSSRNLQRHWTGKEITADPLNSQQKKTSDINLWQFLSGLDETKLPKKPLYKKNTVWELIFRILMFIVWWDFTNSEKLRVNVIFNKMFKRNFCCIAQFSFLSDLKSQYHAKKKLKELYV